MTKKLVKITKEPICAYHKDSVCHGGNCLGRTRKLASPYNGGPAVVLHNNSRCYLDPEYFTVVEEEKPVTWTGKIWIKKVDGGFSARYDPGLPQEISDAFQSAEKNRADNYKKEIEYLVKQKDELKKELEQTENARLHCLMRITDLQKEIEPLRKFSAFIKSFKDILKLVPS